MPENNRSRYPLLAATAYLLVPGERRRKAQEHFRRAGFEAFKGVRALAKPLESEPSAGDGGSGKRQTIRID